MRNHWMEERTIDEGRLPAQRERNPDSSVAAQYEDSVPPDPDSDSDTNEANEPS